MTTPPQVALVTGSSGGIGRAIALRLAEMGAAVAVVARLDARYPATPQDAVNEIISSGGRAVAFECDLSVAKERAGLVTRVEAELGGVDILVNNAAVSNFDYLASFKLSRLDLMLDVQVRTPLELAQAVLPGMKNRGRGWIVNVSSKAADHPTIPPVREGVSLNTVYGMCKAAVERFSTGLAAELYDDGIDVNALAPTYIVPTFGAKAFFDLAQRELESPDDMARATAALIRPLEARITGGVLYSQDVLASVGLRPAEVVLP